MIQDYVCLSSDGTFNNISLEVIAIGNLRTVEGCKERPIVRMRGQDLAR